MNTYYPPDLDEAVKNWDANCGPIALAAIIGEKMAVVKKHLLRWNRRKPYMNPSDMKASLLSMGKPFALFKDTKKTLLPKHGLAFIQWCGPWESHAFAAYGHTHWVASDQGEVFDINNEYEPWLSKADWEKDTVPRIIAAHARAAGGWYVRSGLEL